MSRAMLASLHPTSPTSDHAVKDLLDQRARASHTRFASLSFSQRSDSPSIYSRGDCSPSALYMPRGDLPAHSGYPPSPGGHSLFDDADEELRPPSALSFIDHHEQSASGANEHEDEDSTSFISAPTPKPAFHQGADPMCTLDLEEGPSPEEGEEDPRLSLLGPKMRFVSLAPWETGDDDLLEEDEEDPSGVADGMSIFGGKVGPWRSRDQDKTSSKGLGLATFRSRSPGPPSGVGRKGGIGMNFGLNRHKTPEPQGESPYGPYLTGASQSHNAIFTTLASSSGSSHSVTDSQSSDNFAQRPSFQSGRSGPASPARASPLPRLPFPTAHASRTKNGPYSLQDDSSVSSLRSDSPPARYVHPYANPDVLPSAEPLHSTPFPRTPGKSRDLSGEERERRMSPSPRRASESPLSSPRPITLRKASVPVLPSRMVAGDDENSEESMYPLAQAQARASSSTTPSSPVRSMMAFGDQPGSPMHNLITLEQARARAQNTQRVSSEAHKGGNAASSSARANPSSTLVAGLGLAPGVVVDNGVVRGQGQRSVPASNPHSEHPWETRPPTQSQIPHQRPRAASSGKYMFGGGPIAAPDGDAIPAKTLKHKKSAFMKLFQGGKDKEREKEQLRDLPPVPVPTARAASTPPQAYPSDSPVPPLPGAHNIKRIPPPPLAVVVTSPSMPSGGSPPRAAHGSSAMRPISPPRHRQASSPLPSSATRISNESSSQEQWSGFNDYSHSKPSNSSVPAASAPPSQTTFTTLSLRPVSTIFSAKFPDLLDPSSPPPTNPPAISERRPSYPSPTTPGFIYSRSNSISTASDRDYPVTPTSAVPLPGAPTIEPVSGEDQSAVIAALQEQIINSRKTWQRHIWELEGQVKDLKTEVEELRNAGECETCGKAKREGRIRTPVPQHTSIVDRPRPRMGGGARSVFGGGSDM